MAFGFGAQASIEASASINASASASASASAGGGAGALARRDPSPAYRFYVEINGILEGTFTECAGLSVEREVFPYKEGGVNDYTHKLPGPVKSSNLTLKRGYMFSKELWQWFAAGLYDAKVEYKNVSVITYNVDGSVSRRWDLSRAFPVKWSSPELKADSNQAAIETLEIAYHSMSFAQAS